MSKEVIAIDGPAGAGKSTVAKAVASQLGFTFLDTGAMYRAVALLALREGIKLDDGGAAGKIAREMDLHFEASVVQHVVVNGEDVTQLIRTSEVSEAASALSSFSAVRRELVKRQQAMLAKGHVVLEGRDTTTVVCPDAKLKVYLTASVRERARRRWLELTCGPAPQQTGGTAVAGITLEEIERQIEQRDLRDMTRDDSPLRVADDAVVIDTDSMSPAQVVAAVLSAWRTVDSAT